ncbi:uncharacterized protein [Amphiura filiformis]|uniref:uncharacterized protein n=1 Tax=Amphiura filiformis TaxID=82378 RepID=UPI003B21AC99
MATALPIDRIEYGELTFQEQIGQGGFGVVNHVSFNTPFNGYQQAAAKSLFNLEDGEIQVMSQLSHKNIVKLIGFSQAGPMHVILMEYAPNGSLHDYLSDSSKPLTNELKQKWAEESALAIQYLHDLNYMHRDIKPSNCLLFDDNLLKLCDFGLARKLKHSESTSSQKGNDQGRFVFSKPADIYAYGMLILEICTRKPPFQTWEWHKVVFEVGGGAKPTIPRDCSKDHAKIMQQCWEYNPKQRPTIASILAVLKCDREALYTWSLENDIKPPQTAYNIACIPGNGDLVTCNYLSNKIDILDSDGKYKLSFTPTEQDSNQPIAVVGIFVSPQQDILVVGLGFKSILVCDKQGKYRHCFNTLTQGEDENTNVKLWCIAIDKEEKVLVCDRARGLITIHTYPDGNVVKKINCHSIGYNPRMAVNSKNQILIHSHPIGSVYSKVVAIDYSGNEVFSFTPRVDEDVTSDEVWPGGIVCADGDNI